MLLSMLRSGNVSFIGIIVYILSTLMTIFLVLPLHECAHALVALKLGDTTAKWQGRITLNPLKHIDYAGAALMILLGFGWAKPVPINPRNFKNPKAGMALTALAGPLSNLLAAILAALLMHTLQVLVLKSILPYHEFLEYVYLFFYFLCSINIGLAVFNMIPLPPLDGSKILMAFLPDQAVEWMLVNQRTLSIGLMILIAMGGLNGILSYADGKLYDFVYWLTGLPFSAA